MHVPELLIVLVSILVGAKLLGELAERVGQPAVLGELAAGVLLGPSLLGLVDPQLEVIHLFAELGVIVLLFEIGLETDLRKLARAGGAATTVAIVGVALPFGLGYAVSTLFGLDSLVAVVIGASLTATSVGITARVLGDLGQLNSPEGQTILGAAIIDDVLGLIILAVVARMVAGAEITPLSVARTTGLAFGFLGLTLLVGRLLVPPLFALLGRVTGEDRLAPLGLALAFLCAALADAAGSAMIIGAFAAGAVLHGTEQAPVVEKGVARLGHFFVPIFFVAVGAAVDVREFANPSVMSLGGALIAVAILGKFLAGYAPFWMRGNRRLIGVGMVPRGEVGLIFAQTGLAAGVLTPGLFSAVTLMVMVTTFVAPPGLKYLIRHAEQPPPERHEFGIADITTDA